MQDLLPQHLYLLLSYNRCLYTAIFYLFMAIFIGEENKERRVEGEVREDFGEKS
jgi:hypothetical protein